MTTVKLDIDQPRVPVLVAKVGRLARLCGWTVRGLIYTRTRRGWHVEILVRERVPLLAVVAAQAVLGSDRNRETFNLMRAVRCARGGVPRFWRERVNVLFQRKVGT